MQWGICARDWHLNYTQAPQPHISNLYRRSAAASL